MKIETKHIKQWNHAANAGEIRGALEKMPPDGKVKLDFSGLGSPSTAKTTLIVITTEDLLEDLEP